MHPISPCGSNGSVSGVQALWKLSSKKMEETVHGSYSWCRLTKRETY